MLDCLIDIAIPFISKVRKYCLIVGQSSSSLENLLASYSVFRSYLGLLLTHILTVLNDLSIFFFVCLFCLGCSFVLPGLLLSDDYKYHGGYVACQDNPNLGNLMKYNHQYVFQKLFIYSAAPCLSCGKWDR